MKNFKKILSIFIPLSLVLLAVAGMVYARFPLKEAPRRMQREYVLDEILVKFKNDSRPFRVLKVPQGEVGDRIREYLERRDVEYAEPNFYAHALWSPNDDFYPYQWHFDNTSYGGIEMEEAWDQAASPGQGAVVAVIDTGVAFEDYCEGSRWWGTCYEKAPDFQDTCFVPGYDFVNSDFHPNDDSSPGHGTHVAGTIAQSTNNTEGTAGIAFESCLMPVKVLGSDGSGTYADVAEGIIWAADNGADVINLSLGGSQSSQTLEDAVAYAYQQGVTVVAAAGNDGSSQINYPAAYNDYVIAVGATGFDETLAPYSNYGADLDLVAPGGNLDVDLNGDGYGDGVLQQTFEMNWRRFYWSYYFFEGTSMAAPHVSGVSALLISEGKASSPDEVRSILQETADDLGQSGRDNTYGWGLVNAASALGWNPEPVIVCSENSECEDSSPCTQDVCVNPGTVDSYCSNSSVADGTLCDDGKFCTVNDRCTAGACGGEVRDCSDGVACTQDSCDESADTCENTADHSYCSDGLYCNGLEYCDLSLGCQAGVAVDCDDGNECTADSCDEGADSCQNTDLQDNTLCSGGVCCSGVCEIGATECSAAIQCWDADFQYLRYNRNQFEKFCKCAAGSYGYTGYRYGFGRNTVYEYIDTSDNENWDVYPRSSYISVYEVVCPDGKIYPTNQDYFYQ